jgi:hypothetical protein
MDNGSGRKLKGCRGVPIPFLAGTFRRPPRQTYLNPPFVKARPELARLVPAVRPLGAETAG